MTDSGSRPSQPVNRRSHWNAARARLAARLTVPARSEWRPGNSLVWDVLALAAILLAAILLRYVDLETVPYGIHGDEAMAVLEGRRTLDVGWYGVWNNMAGGFPAGFIYLVAPMVWLFGEQLLAVRYLSAGIDVVTVLALYVTLRRSFGFGTAVIGSGLLAVSAWHIQFSRIAFPNILWPALVMLSCLALGEAIRRNSCRWWAASGALMALAIYSYNSHFLYLGVVAAFLAFHFLGWRGLALIPAAALALLGPVFAMVGVAIAGLVAPVHAVRTLTRSQITQAGSFLAGFAIVIYPMAEFILSHWDQYFSRGRNISVFRTEQWRSLSGHEAQARFLLDRYWEFWVRLASNPVPDAVDGSGAAVIIPVTTITMCGIGAVLGLLRRRHPLIELAIFTIVLMPFAAISTNDLALRRSMILAPFVALLAGLGIVEVLRLAWSTPFIPRLAVCLAMAVLLVQIGYRNVDGFFNHTTKSEEMRWVLSVEWVEAARFMDSLPDGSYVYLYSERWPYNHETRMLLAPETSGESRGERFGENSMAIDSANGKPVVILMGAYRERLSEFEARYPNGHVQLGPSDRAPTPGPSFIAYFVPAGVATAAPGTSHGNAIP